MAKFLTPESLSLISVIISVIALSVSLLTAWFTIFHRGALRSTRPSLIVFKYETGGTSQPLAKIFLRTLLFSTGKRGRVIESLFLRVRESGRFEEFSFWGHGDKDLVRGSGLFVGENGFVTNHHFTPIRNMHYQFVVGTYDLELVAKLMNRNHLVSLLRIVLDLPAGAFDPHLVSHDTAVWFNWSPEQKRYVASIERRDT